MTTWYWEYVKALDSWNLHAPDYTPEVSWILTRQGDRQIIGRCTDTTMPEGVQRIIHKITETTDFFQYVDKGITQITVQGEEIKKYARRLDLLVEQWKQIEVKKAEAVQASAGGL